MNSLLKEAVSILQEDFQYAFCGGYAIDLFLGYESQKHGDIDILAYWEERNCIILYMQSMGKSLWAKISLFFGKDSYLGKTVASI